MMDSILSRIFLGKHGRLLVKASTNLNPDYWLFHNIIDDPGSFVEVNLSQMLAYAIYRGLIAGWLPGEYEKPARSLRRAVSGKVDRFGARAGRLRIAAF
jgi:unsaturated rhamnogalacturonyl hydrolase